MRCDAGAVGCCFAGIAKSSDRSIAKDGGIVLEYVRMFVDLVASTRSVYVVQCCSTILRASRQVNYLLKILGQKIVLEGRSGTHAGIVPMTASQAYQSDAAFTTGPNL